MYGGPSRLPPPKCSITGCPPARYISLADNELSGPVPDLSALGPSLVGLDLGNNKFSGLLPASISKLRSLFVLSLRDNSFWGPVGDALTNLTSLQFVCV